jgi:hypothetical protein
MPTAPNVAYAALVAHPRAFLRRYGVTITADPGVSGIYNYYLKNAGAAQRPGRVLRTLRMHATERFRIDRQNTPGSHPFQAYSIQMVPSNAPGAIVLYQLPAAAGPNIMVTGGLSGCSFLINDLGGGAVECAHLEPHGETGVQLNNRLIGPPHAFDVVYGRNSYGHTQNNVAGLYDRSVSVIGVRAGGAWRIYAQKYDPYTNQIRSVHRIFPAE